MESNTYRINYVSCIGLPAHVNIEADCEAEARFAFMEALPYNIISVERVNA